MVRFASVGFAVLLAQPLVARAEPPSPARAAHEVSVGRQPVEVASGQDLVAWQSLEQLRLRGAAAIVAYRGFLLDYSASPLAVVAWSRLVELGAAWVEDKDDRIAKTLTAVRDRWAVLESLVAAGPRRAEVASIDLSEPEDDATAAARDTGN